MRLIPALAVMALIVTVSGSSIASVPAPRVSAQNFDQLAKPLPLPYHDTNAAMVAVNKARARARSANKLLLVDLGGNWCLDCRILAGTMELPELKAWIARHYEVVTVDVGRFDKNLDVPARYRFKDRLAGVPALLIVDPKTDKLVNTGKTTALSDARSMNPQGLADYLARYAR